jgi:Flp pilus assembly protein TadD
LPPIAALSRARLAGTVALGLVAGVCLSAAPQVQPRTPLRPVTFTGDIAGLLFDRCGVCHHPDGAAPFSLLTYSEARQHATQIAAMTRRRLMPPWKAVPGSGPFVDQQPLSDAEIDRFQQWAAAGAPEGDHRPLPTPSWTEGWRLGSPDLIVTLPKPFLVPAGGGDISRVFVFPLRLSELRYVKGLEFRPGNSKVVHHANIRIDRTPASRQLDARDPEPGYEGVLLHSAIYPDGHFLGWTPGQAAPLLPPGLAWRLEPGTDLVVEMHLQPSGKVEEIAPSIGLYFGSDPPLRTPAMLRLGRQDIAIRPGDKAYTSTDSFVLPVDVEVQAVQPHAHYRARDVRGSATLPDGTTKVLIHIDDWDFRWQHVYRYVTPVALPKGTTVAVRYTFDNSEENPRNPIQPPVPVRWGQRSTDEMGDLWIQVLTRDDRDLQTLNLAIRPKVAAEDIVGYEGMIRADPSRVQLHDDVAVLYLEQNQVAEATAYFESSAALEPGSPAAHYNLGTTLTMAGRLTEAEARFRQALHLRPDYALAHNNLGDVLVRGGRLAEALQHYQEALRLDPEYAAAHYNAASVLRSQGDLVAAIAGFRRALALRPDWVPPLVALAWSLATAPDPALRDADEAVRLAERAADLTGGRDRTALDALAAARAAARTPRSPRP